MDTPFLFIYYNIIPFLCIDDFISLLKVDNNHFELRKLNMDNINVCDRFTLVIKNDNDIKKIMEYKEIYYYFTKIKIEHNNMTDEQLIDIFGILNKLHTLDISGCRQFNDKIFDKLNNLYTLDVSGCRQFTNKIFDGINVRR